MSPTPEPEIRLRPAREEMSGTRIFGQASPSVYVLLTYTSTAQQRLGRNSRLGSAVAVTERLAFTQLVA